MKHYCALILLFGILFSLSLADEDEDEDDDGVKEKVGDVMKKFEDVIPLKDVGDWFRNAGEEVKNRAESGIETMKEFSDQAQEKSESGMDAMKGFAGGIGDRFSKAKDKLEESGEKMKEALSTAAEKSKEEFGTAASKISTFAKEVPGTFFSMFGKF